MENKFSEFYLNSIQISKSSFTSKLSDKSSNCIVETGHGDIFVNIQDFLNERKKSQTNNKRTN